MIDEIAVRTAHTLIPIAVGIGTVLAYLPVVIALALVALVLL